MLQPARWKTLAAWLAVVASLVVLLPSVLPPGARDGLPEWLSAKRLQPGLDLSGGAGLTLKIERSDIEDDRLLAVVNAAGQSLRSAKIPYADLAGSGREITLRINDAARVEEARTALSVISGTTVTAAGDGTVKLVVSAESIDVAEDEAAQTTLDVVRERVSQVGGVNADLRLSGRDRVVLQVPGYSDPQRLKDILAQRGAFSARLAESGVSVQQALEEGPPPGTEVVYTMGEPPVGYLVRRSAIFTSRDVVSAEMVLGTDGEGASVVYQLSPDASRRLAEATAANVGRTLALLLDDQILAAFEIAAPVVDGRGEISGDFDAEGAANLAVVLRSGSLPASLTVVEERSIEPAFGGASARAALFAVGAAGLAVALFMIVWYGAFGAIAVLALLFNLLLVLALIALSGTPLTLPGIAGMVLTIGIAVDASVLIYERMREETANGRPLADALATAFSRTFSTMLDSGITTLIAALVLFFMGAGPMRGFAVTVGIGIFTTLFVTFTLSRWLVWRWVSLRRLTHLPRSVRTGLFASLHLRFMAIRNYTFAASAVAALAVALLVGVGGINLGIDFTGGSLLEVRARQGAADAADIVGRLDEANLGDATVRVGLDRAAAMVRIPPQGGGENAEQTSALVARGELEAAGYDIRRVEVVGPSISGDLISAATIGMAIALAALIAYIWVRFEWQFAIGAIVSVAHDLLLTMGLFALTRMEFNIGSIAALLTIVGYSLNDTLVVYDRIRENLRHFRQMPLPLLIDASISQTLSRTVLTAATTLIALAALAIFGGEIIRAFAFTMLFGIAVGTFSSIYIAGPVLILFRLRPDRYRLGGSGNPAAKA
ncbi:protein translocase subunit SecD [Mycoplana rhizolycopersici]|uniref:Multifunctional fusion protein n=1 Tax=Mycoplana rhizolycopersici TaxID=2746702 RepID=A0ABX2QK61_9HYPH|nr:protein translocase subunit SecD [Rhizobium rhizolycopersici]NVP58182.1 protein translocase subunit SecD [Rhizobium rhizolycopersici]